MQSSQSFEDIFGGGALLVLDIVVDVGVGFVDDADARDLLYAVLTGQPVVIVGRMV